MDTNHTEAVVEQLDQVTAALCALDLEAKLTIKDLATKINEILAVVNELKTSKPQASRDRGPKSEREMTEDDARKILLGELKDKKHMEAAKELGLSYAQVYSARNGYTFKTVYQDWLKASKN